MKTFNAISCIKIGVTELKIIVFDLLTKKVIWRRAFYYDFEVFDNTGGIMNPGQMASFIQDLFHQHKLPKRVRISLSLEYLSINNLLLPAISGAEFHQIILDEAAHVSVYGFTDEKIAVAYQILNNKRNSDGILNTEVFAVTTLQTTINQIIEVFNLAGIKLESISPVLLGLKQYLTQHLPNLHKPIILILVSSEDAEFYMWQGQLPYSCHYIKAGKKTPEILQNEISASLEHFNKTAENGGTLSQVVAVGEQCEFKLGDGYELQYIFEDEWPDLVGLASITKGIEVLNFLRSNPKTDFMKSALVKWLCPVLIGGLVGINIFSGWNLWSSGQRLAQARKEYSGLQNSLIVKKEQLLGKNNNRQLGAGVKVDMLLEKLRSIVSEDMLFDRLEFDLKNKTMQVEGFCVTQKNLDAFLLTLSRIKGVTSVDELESSQQSRENLMGYAFRFSVSFLGDFGDEK
ncbi:MAG TPA: hypothetical protein DDW65_12730 [Firmicutes bacterium]|nr:hypothetical protein [Bacillota bacterium]